MPPHAPLTRRARVTVNGWAGILTIVILASAALFCIVVTVIICRRKRARTQRERKMLMEQQQQPFISQQTPPILVAQEYNAHEYRVAANSDDRGAVELGTASPAQLHAGSGAVEAKPQQLGGFTAPATMGYDGRAVEMPAQSAQGVGR